MVTNGGTAGSDTVVVYADNNGNGVLDSGEPSTQVTANFVAPAPAGATVTVTCSPNATNTAASACQDPVTDHTATFTATVKDSSGNALNGALVTWSEGLHPHSSGKETFTPASCTTNGSGQCSTTLTEPTPTNGESITMTATVNRASGGSATNSATKNWVTPAPEDARNIAVQPKTGTQAPGGAQNFTATVTDRFGNPVQGVCVGWDLTSGPGHFANIIADCQGGYAESQSSTAYDTTCLTRSNGQCEVQVVTGPAETGTTVVTASLDPAATGGASYNYNGTANNECQAPAGKTYSSDGTGSGNSTTPSAAPGAPAGNCTDTGSVTWTNATTSPTPTPTGTSTPPPPGGMTMPGYASGSTFVFGNLSGATVGTAKFGNASDQKVWGDWDGNGTASLGVFRASTGTWYLTNDNKTVAYTFRFGQPGDIGLVGDWNGNGTTSVGVYRPSTETFFLTNGTTGHIDSKLKFGNRGDEPLVGVWDKGGLTRIGVYRPGNHTFYRPDHNGISFGSRGDQAVAGDWDGDGVTSIGVVRGSNWLLSNDDHAVAYNFSFGSSRSSDFTYSNGESAAATVDS
jgi:hypothetical protein